MSPNVRSHVFYQNHFRLRQTASFLPCRAGVYTPHYCRDRRPRLSGFMFSCQNHFRLRQTARFLPCRAALTFLFRQESKQRTRKRGELMRPLPWRKETSPFILSARIARILYVERGVWGAYVYHVILNEVKNPTFRADAREILRQVSG